MLKIVSLINIAMWKKKQKTWKIVRKINNSSVRIFLNVIIMLYCLYDVGLAIPVTVNPQKKEELMFKTNYCCVNLCILQGYLSQWFLYEKLRTLLNAQQYRISLTN